MGAGIGETPSDAAHMQCISLAIHPRSASLHRWIDRRCRHAQGLQDPNEQRSSHGLNRRFFHHSQSTAQSFPMEYRRIYVPHRGSIHILTLAGKNSNETQVSWAAVFSAMISWILRAGGLVTGDSNSFPTHSSLNPSNGSE